MCSLDLDRLQKVRALGIDFFFLIIELLAFRF